jgi:hypothetical protein
MVTTVQNSSWDGVSGMNSSTMHDRSTFFVTSTTS